MRRAWRLLSSDYITFLISCTQHSAPRRKALLLLVQEMVFCLSEGEKVTWIVWIFKILYRYNVGLWWWYIVINKTAVSLFLKKFLGIVPEGRSLARKGNSKILLRRSISAVFVPPLIYWDASKPQICHFLQVERRRFGDQSVATLWNSQQLLSDFPVVSFIFVLRHNWK